LEAGDALAFVLSFSRAHKYAGQPGRDEAIVLPVVLRVGEQQVNLVANLDTGASYCLFERSYAEALGLEVDPGVPKVFVTANSHFEAYGHEVTLNTLGIEMHSLVFFFADAEIEKNVLGRHGWLHRVKVGIVDHDQLLYVAGYDEFSG
jgi:hypothetical protein